MGSITYNFLSESLFFSENGLSNNFKNESESRLKKEIEDYRKFCIENYNDLINEIKERESFLKVFSSTEEVKVELLKQTALYVDQFIVFDPLFKHSDFQSDMTQITGKYLGYDQSGINKKSIAKASRFLKEITPMVAANYVKTFPLSYHFEAPQNVPMNFPLDNYNNILPRPILDFFWENASVKSMKKIDEGGWMVDENELYPCRGIVVDFKNSNLDRSLIYHLFEMEVIDLDEKTGKMKFRQFLPDKAPTKESFATWVKQSVNSASKAYFDKVYNETFIASNLNSTYLCDNNFTNDLLKANFETKESIPTYTATQVMNIDLPFLDKIDIQKLMDIRTYEEDVFTNFRLELEKKFRELRTEPYETFMKEKADNIFHELNEVQGQKIKLKIEHLQKQAKANFAIGMGGLASSIHTSGFSLIATAVALGKGYKDYLEYLDKVKNNPAYLLWKVRNR